MSNSVHEDGGKERMGESMPAIVNPYLMLQSQMVSAEHQRLPPTRLSPKSKKAKHSKDYSPPIACAHADGILQRSLAETQVCVVGEEEGGRRWRS